MSLHAAFVVSLLLSCAPARAKDPKRDAPAAVPAAAALSWRAPAGEPSRPPLEAPSRGLLKKFNSFIDAQPDLKVKAEIAAALEGLIKDVDALKPQERQAWIDGHLGEINAAVRALPQNSPKSLAVKAAASAAGLNNRAERWDVGRELARVALGFDPEDVDALIEHSQASSGLGDFARAYADADAVLRKTPSSTAAWTARAAAAYGLGNYLQALEDARRALAVNPNDKTAYALLKLSEGRSQAAPQFDNGSLGESVEREYHGMVQQLNQVEAMRHAPTERGMDQSLRRLLDAAGSKLTVKDFHGALEEADKALLMSPGSPDALYYRATAQNLLGRYGDAARDATRALALAPTVAALRDARALAYTRMGRYADAIADANHSLEIDPKNPYAYANRGHAQEGRGDYQAMAADLKTAAELNAQFEPDYRDSTRRQGVKTEPIRGGRLSRPLGPRIPWRVRSSLIVLASSLIGGLLIALGLMHVGTEFKKSPIKKDVTPAVLEAHYELDRPIGWGGMGVVYAARDKLLNRPVAVKMLRDEFALDEQAKKDLAAEARTVAELHHPAIVDIHAVEQDEHGLYLVFERLEGRTLDKLIAEKRLSFSEIKNVLGPVCSAVDYAHAHDVIHLDIKPQNIMLTQDGGVKILDFGIARHAARSGKKTTTQSIIGTPHYMAPEQEYGFVRRENDVFALGAVFYEMLTGLRPFEGPTPAKLAKKFIPPSQLVKDLDPAFDALINRALEPDPDKRIASASEFWDQLCAIPENLIGVS
jgi:tetratricopeptide (TPR) repeat protein